MIGAKPANHVLVIGAANSALVAEIALITGLNGRTVAVDRAADSEQRIGDAAARAGTLVDYTDAPATMLPIDPDMFDIVVVQRTLTPTDRSQVVGEAARVVRPGGRLIIIVRAQRAGVFGALSRRSPPSDDSDATLDALRATGLKAVRVLGQENETQFLEGTKPK